MRIGISDIDRKYYSDVANWKLGSDNIEVADNNDHLGQIISGHKQEEKNVDLRLEKGRKALFSLLGSGFSVKCQLNPQLKLHLWKTYICPVLKSGLSSFVLKPHTLEPLMIF